MEKTELEIKTIDTENGKVFVLNRNIDGITDTYEIVLVTETFKKQETKLLINEIERHLKKLYKSKGVNINGTDKKSLKMAYNELQAKGYNIEIVDRYKNLQHEEIIGAYNGMTIIQEENTLSCAMEIEVRDYRKENLVKITWSERLQLNQAHAIGNEEYMRTMLEIIRAKQKIREVANGKH